MLIQDRIQLIIKVNNETSSSFADKIGVKRSNLSHVLSGRNNPSLDFLAKIITYYPNVNASWLVTGTTRDGDFKDDDANLQGKTAESVENHFDKDVEIEKVLIFYKNGSFKSYLPNEQ